MVGAMAELGPGPILDITRIPELKGITVADDAVAIGGATTWSELVAADLPSGFDGLKAAAREVGSVQIQNRGTIAGNLCNASPAADGVPPLLTLDAELELRSSEASRRLPLAEFITGNRKTRLQPGELVTGIRIPRRLSEGHSSFLKLGSRRYLVISIVSVAVLLLPDRQDRIAEARIAVGACSAVPLRLPALEAALTGRPFDASIQDAVTAGHAATLTPIDDVRGTAGYRRDAARHLLRQALLACVDGRAGGMA